jgi:hypothetical protein
MFKLFFILLFSTLSAAGQAAELPPLDATVSYDSKTVNHAGVTEIRQFRNVLVRRPGHVWLERILPAQTEAAQKQEAAETHVGHKHFDFDTSIQHLTRTAAGEVRADYVDRGHRQIVFVPPTEYSVSGFDGSWDNAAALIAEKTVKAMPLSKRTSSIANTEWHESQRNGRYSRVLWSNQYQIALVIESGRSDGSIERKTTVALRPTSPDQTLPWTKLAGYEQKEYDDFMD